MSALLPQPDPHGLLEYSVVYTDRALNHMSQRFQGVMKDISRVVKQVYNAKSTVIVPGSGTFGMEAVARQFATGKKCLVIRNGWFSYRWTQIFETGGIPAESIVLKARQRGEGVQAPFAPAPIAEVVDNGFPSVAVDGFQAPGVVVSHTSDPEIQSGKKFLVNGLQIAAGVPLQCDEPAGFRSFRIGLFGLDKLHNPDRTLENLKIAIAKLA